MSKDLSKYIGLPYTEFNCWQLSALVQRDLWGRELPLFEYVDARNRFAVARAIKQQRQTNYWQELKQPVDGCLVLMDRAKTPTHLGVYIGDWRCVLHTSIASGSLLSPIITLLGVWNLNGFYNPAGN